MAKGYGGGNRNGWILLLMLFSGIVIGGFLGALLGKYIPVLKFGYDLSISPHTWNLGILKLTLGIALNLNMFGVIGILAAIYFYRKM